MSENEDLKTYLRRQMIEEGYNVYYDPNRSKYFMAPPNVMDFIADVIEEANSGMGVRYSMLGNGAYSVGIYDTRDVSDTLEEILSDSRKEYMEWLSKNFVVEES